MEKPNLPDKGEVHALFEENPRNLEHYLSYLYFIESAVKGFDNVKLQ